MPCSQPASLLTLSTPSIETCSRARARHGPDHAEPVASTEADDQDGSFKSIITNFKKADPRRSSKCDSQCSHNDTRYPSEIAASRTCFVCEDDSAASGEVYQICMCKDRWLHLHCQEALMNNTPSHARACPVCATSYSNVKLKRSRHVSRRQCGMLALFLLGETLLFGSGAYELAGWLETRSIGAIVVSIFMFSAACIIGVCSIIFRSEMPWASCIGYRTRATVVAPTKHRVSTTATSTTADMPARSLIPAGAVLATAGPMPGVLVISTLRSSASSSRGSTPPLPRPPSVISACRDSTPPVHRASGVISALRNSSRNSSPASTPPRIRPPSLASADSLGSLAGQHRLAHAWPRRASNEENDT